MLYKCEGHKKIAIKITVKHAQTINEQTKGLMFLKKKNFDFALIFHFKSSNRFFNSIHMFFVFFPIITIFLDDKKKVVDKKILTPFYPFYMSKKSCKYLIEMPIKFKNKIKIGDKLNWN